MTSPGQRRAKGHAILARKMDRPDAPPRPGGTGDGGPYLPEIGEVYWVLSLLYSSNDKAAERPCLVVTVPSTAHGTIQIVTRTSQDVVGVPHPADDGLDLNKPGVFAGLNSVDQSLWTAQNVRYVGRLPQPYLDQVLEMSS